MAAVFPAIVRENLVGIYLWGSLTYNAFDATCSDVDYIVVTRRDLDDREFSQLDEWFRNKRDRNRWVERIDMRFVIENDFLDKTSRCRPAQTTGWWLPGDKSFTNVFCNCTAATARLTAR